MVVSHFRFPEPSPPSPATAPQPRPPCLALVWWLLSCPSCSCVGVMAEDGALGKAWAQSHERRRKRGREQVRKGKPVPAVRDAVSPARRPGLLGRSPCSPESPPSVTSVYSNPAWVLRLFPYAIGEASMFRFHCKGDPGFQAKDPGSWETAVPGAGSAT